VLHWTPVQGKNLVIKEEGERTCLYMTQFAYTPEAWKALVKKRTGPPFAEQAEEWTHDLALLLHG